jgi:hypothetical protein
MLHRAPCSVLRTRRKRAANDSRNRNGSTGDQIFHRYTPCLELEGAALQPDNVHAELLHQGNVQHYVVACRPGQRRALAVRRASRPSSGVLAGHLCSITPYSLRTMNSVRTRCNGLEIDQLSGLMQITPNPKDQQRAWPALQVEARHPFTPRDFHRLDHTSLAGAPTRSFRGRLRGATAARSDRVFCQSSFAEIFSIAKSAAAEVAALQISHSDFDDD